MRIRLAAASLLLTTFSAAAGTPTPSSTTRARSSAAQSPSRRARYAMVRAANLASCRRYPRSSVLRIFGVRRFGLKPRSELCAKT
jgi:hypothetical protein